MLLERRKAALYNHSYQGAFSANRGSDVYRDDPYGLTGYTGHSQHGPLNSMG